MWHRSPPSPAGQPPWRRPWAGAESATSNTSSGELVRGLNVQSGHGKPLSEGRAVPLGEVSDEESWQPACD